MKKLLFYAIALIVCISVAGGLTFSPKSASAEDTVVTFPDSNLETAVRKAMEKPDGDIYVTDLQAVTIISCNARNVSSLVGLEYCANLTTLSLDSNQITDISPLANCTKLEAIDLTNNRVSDISPLANLTSLNYVRLKNNLISDVKPLVDNTGLVVGIVWLEGNPLSEASVDIYIPQLKERKFLAVHHNSSNCQIVEFPDPNLERRIRNTLDKSNGGDIYAADLEALTRILYANSDISDITGIENCINLDNLSLGHNNISDISPLASLTSVRNLNLYRNQISDISALANLTKLYDILLAYNQISDIQPLVANTGLGDGDIVRLRNNPLSDLSINTYIPQLEARGVEVDYDIPEEVEETSSPTETVTPDEESTDDDATPESQPVEEVEETPAPTETVTPDEESTDDDASHEPQPAEEVEETPAPTETVTPDEENADSDASHESDNQDTDVESDGNFIEQLIKRIAEFFNSLKS